jgi:hypothetical protein
MQQRGMSTAADGKTVLRRRAPGWIAALVTTVLVGGLAFGFMILAAVQLFDGNTRLGLVILAVSVWMLVLADYLRRDCRAKRGWMIEIEPGELFLDLPDGRSLMARQTRVRCRLDVSDVAAIETRLESFRAFGLGNLQRSYALRLKSGALIVLGEDRALATKLADETLARMVDILTRMTGLALHDRGMVDGKGGFLGVLFTSVPEWDAPSLTAQQQSDRWRRAGMTGGIVALAAALAWLIAAAR